MRVQLKLREASSARERKTFLKRLETEVEHVEPLFPEETDDELASMYVLDLADDAPKDTLTKLAREPEVEFAEPEVSRRLILPEEVRVSSKRKRSRRKSSTR
jgi:predicted house-cleaning NTP pyrophosphatase (Maf/HAM1 superfamily)